MSEETTETEETPEKKSKLPLIIVGVAALAVGAGGMFVVTGMKSEPEAETADAEAVGEGEEAVEGEVVAESDEPFEERVVALDPFVINLGDAGRARYLKLTVNLEASSSAGKLEIETQVPKIRDAVIVLLSSRRLADLREFEGKALLKEEVLQRVNDTFDEPLVQSVLFTEFVVQ